MNIYHSEADLVHFYENVAAEDSAATQTESCKRLGERPVALVGLGLLLVAMVNAYWRLRA